MITNGSRASEYSDAGKRQMPFWEQLNGDVRAALALAWDEARTRKAAEVHKLHLVKAVLKDGRIHSRIDLLERSMDKLEALIQEQLRITEPQDTAVNGAAKAPTLSWGADVVEILGNAANRAQYYSVNTVDIGMVFDLLQNDEKLKGNFHFAKSGHADDLDARMDKINALAYRRDTETERLKNAVTGLELENQKLYGEIAAARKEFAELRNDIGATKQQIARIQPFEQRLAQVEQYLYQHHGAITQAQAALTQLQATVQHTIWPMLQSLLVSRPGPMSPHASPSHGYGSQAAGSYGAGSYDNTDTAPAGRPAPAAAQPAADKGWLNLGGLFGSSRSAQPTPAATAQAGSAQQPTVLVTPPPSQMAAAPGTTAPGTSAPGASTATPANPLAGFQAVTTSLPGAHVPASAPAPASPSTTHATAGNVAETGVTAANVAHIMSGAAPARQPAAAAAHGSGQHGSGANGSGLNGAAPHGAGGTGAGTVTGLNTAGLNGQRPASAPAAPQGSNQPSLIPGKTLAAAAE